MLIGLRLDIDWHVARATQSRVQRAPAMNRACMPSTRKTRHALPRIAHALRSEEKPFMPRPKIDPKRPLAAQAVMNVDKGEEIAGMWVTKNVPQIGIYKLLAKKKKAQWMIYRKAMK